MIPINVRLKISNSLRGHIVTEATREKLRIANKGKIISEGTRKKMSVALKGRKLSIEQRQLLSKINKGKKPSPESIEKNRNSHKGRKLSEETKKKIGASSKKVMESPGIRKRISELLKGDKSPLWKGGISFEPYCYKFRPEFKERVREFFGRVCLNCGMTEQENKKIFDERLSIHHVNFDKSSCCSDVKPLYVPLCKKCHSKTNFNRDYWEEYFSKIIIEKYNGICFLPFGTEVKTN